MSGMRLRALLWGVMAIGLAICAFLQFSAQLPLQTNLLALLPPTERNPLAEEAVNRLADAAGNRAVFLVGGGSAERAEQAARSFAVRLRETRAFRQVVVDIPPIEPQQITGLYRKHRFNVLGDADRADFPASAEALDARLQRKLYAPFQFGLTLPVGDDPFGLVDTWLADLPLKGFRLELENGLLQARSAGKVWVLVAGELSGSSYDDSVQRQVVAGVRDAEGDLRASFPEVDVLRTGTVFYAAAARASAEREVDIIGAGSLIGMLVLLFLVFRSVRPLLLGLLSVGFGIVAAVVATVAVYGEIHLIALVFGASLIGEAIDYAIQYFAAHLGAGAGWEPMAGLRRIAPGLSVALGTSLLGYGALMLAPFPALSQIALFALVGLFSAWLTVFLLLPYLLQRPARRDPDAAMAVPQRFLVWWQARVSQRMCLLLALGVLAVSVPGWLRLSGNDDVHLLVTRPADLLAQEEKIRELTGFGNGSQFFLVEGASEDAVLANEERLAERLVALQAAGEITGVQRVSAFVPSPARQRENRTRWESGVFADTERLTQLLSDAGLRDEVGVRLIGDFAASKGQVLRVGEWLETPIAAPFRYLWFGQTANGAASVVQPQGVRDVERLHAATSGLAGVTLVDKAASVSRLFHDYRKWGWAWLAAAASLVYGVLCLRYGPRLAAVMLLPTALAMALVQGVFGYLGIALTLFNLMGLMLVMGVGVNYAIFLREGGLRTAATLAGVLLSAGTTLLSFGLLAFSSMPALSGFGLTLLLGIAIAVMFAPMVLSFPPKGVA